MRTPPLNWPAAWKTTTTPPPFAGLGDWHLLRALAIHRPELARPYVHLVDQEPFDED